jgi:hypothetical protein
LLLLLLLKQDLFPLLLQLLLSSLFVNAIGNLPGQSRINAGNQ